MSSYRYLACLTAGLLTLPTAAFASTYVSNTNATRLVLREKTSPPSGFYFTTAAGRQWMGNIQINQSSGAAGSMYYTGTFRDRTMGPGPQRTCTGTITIRRHMAPGRGDRMAADATWRVTGGSNCGSVGQTIQLNLLEPLPQPTRTGDYNAQNSNTYESETSGAYTWPQWRVVSRDGELNCRATPNGTIQRVYRSGQNTVQAETRGGNAFRPDASGNPWLLTRDRCYVRANASYIRPISVPD